MKLLDRLLSVETKILVDKLRTYEWDSVSEFADVAERGTFSLFEHAVVRLELRRYYKRATKQAILRNLGSTGVNNFTADGRPMYSSMFANKYE